MRLRRLLPALLLAACSSETPAPVDAQAAADLCVCQDGTVLPDAPAEDRPDVVAPPADAADAGDPPDVVDASAAVDAHDASPPVDAQLADAPDVVAMGALDVAVAVADAATVDAVDVVAPADAPDVAAVADVVDAARDTGPVDAGPVVYDLNAVRTGLEVVGLYRQTLSRGTVSDCTAPTTAASCSVTGDTLRFAFAQCGVDFVGSFSVSTTSMRALSLAIGGAGHFAPSPQIEAGSTRPGAPSRQSFHVQYARAVNGPAPGASGIPGRTVDPMLGDIWLLGCEAR